MKSKGRLARLALALVILSILAVPMTVSAAPPTPPSGPTSPGTTAVPVWGEPTTVRSRYGLRLREGPSLYNRIILVLHNGETVTRGAGPVWGGGRWWTYVRVWRWGTYYEGFCASAYLANYDPGAPPSGGGDLMVTAGIGLRLRWGPGTWYGVYKVMPYGVALQPTGVTQWGGGLQWTQVTVDGYNLWAASMYLRQI